MVTETEHLCIGTNMRRSAEFRNANRAMYMAGYMAGYTAIWLQPMSYHFALIQSLL